MPPVDGRLHARLIAVPSSGQSHKGPATASSVLENLSRHPAGIDEKMMKRQLLRSGVAERSLKEAHLHDMEAPMRGVVSGNLHGEKMKSALSGTRSTERMLPASGHSELPL